MHRSHTLYEDRSKAERSSERGRCSRIACDLKVSTISELVDELDVDEDGVTTSTTRAVPRRFHTRTVEDDFFPFPDPAELQK